MRLMSSAVGALDLISHSDDCTHRLGFRLGRRLRGGDVVLLTRLEEGQYATVLQLPAEPEKTGRSKTSRTDEPAQILPSG